MESSEISVDELEEQIRRRFVVWIVSMLRSYQKHSSWSSQWMLAGLMNRLSLLVGQSQATDQV